MTGRDVPEVVSINLGRRRAVLDTGEEIPITDLIDAAGEETDDEGEAVMAVAGPYGPRQRWIAFAVADFGPAMGLH